MSRAGLDDGVHSAVERSSIDVLEEGTTGPMDTSDFVVLLAIGNIPYLGVAVLSRNDLGLRLIRGAAISGTMALGTSGVVLRGATGRTRQAYSTRPMRVRMASRTTASTGVRRASG